MRTRKIACRAISTLLFLGICMSAHATYFDSETGQLYNGNRTLDPSAGRYIEADPIGLQGGINSYLYVNASPLALTDPLGLNPGDLFKTPDDAAIDMFNYILSNARFKSFIEYGNWVYEKTKCYTYDEPIEGETKGKNKGAMLSGSSIPPKPPTGVGFFHTHGTRGFLPNSPSADFSDGDLSEASQSAYGTQWMGTNIFQPNGSLSPRLRKNIPGKPSFTVPMRKPQQCTCDS